jgi:hypothetical protein
MHDNDGKDHRARNYAVAACFDDLFEHFNELKKMHDEANDMPFVREVTGMGLHVEEKATELASHFTKRRIYELFCWERGWKGMSNNTGAYLPLVTYEQQPFDEDDWPEQSQALPVCYWASLIKIWKDHFPIMRIRAPSRDVRGECYIYKNALRYKTALVSEDPEDKGEEAEEEDEELQQILCGPQQGGRAIASCDSDSYHKDYNNVGSDAIKFKTTRLTHEEESWVKSATARAEVAQVDEWQSNEMILANASGQVVMARTMRRFAQYIALAAIQQLRGDMPHLQCEYVLVDDYGHILLAPYFGGAQPGDTYYF